MVNAEAIAIISLKKNNLNEDQGKGLGSPFPNFWVKSLSLVIPTVVLTANTTNNFEIAGSRYEIE